MDWPDAISSSSRQVIHASFVSKFDEIKAHPSKLGKGKKVEYAPEDIAEVKQLVLEGQEDETRRNAIVGLFKLSLRDGLESLLVEEGASVICQLACTAEPKGSGARRAAVQALRNLTSHPSTREAIVGAAPDLAAVIEEEAPASGPREAALETLVNLSELEENCVVMAEMEKVLPALQSASTSETQGSTGKEAALKVMARLQAAMAKPKSGLEQTEEQAGQLIQACMSSLSTEAKGSGARVVAMKALKDVVGGKWRTLLMSKHGILPAIVGAARTESPGSEGRAAAFALLSELALYPEHRLGLMRTNGLFEAVIAAVREEPVGSQGREEAFYAVARLCLHPDNRRVFMAQEGLVGVCIRAAQQEPVGSTGRAAAIEALAGLAMAPENQALLLASPGVVAMAVEGAGDADDRVRGAGLNLLSSLALLPANRAALADTSSLLPRVVASLTKGEPDSEVLAASADIIKSLLSDAKGRKAVLAAMPNVTERLWEIVADTEPNGRASASALAGLLSLANAPAAPAGGSSPSSSISSPTKEHAQHMVEAVRDANSGSQSRLDAMSLMRLAVQGGGAARIADCGGVQEMLSKLAQVARGGVESASEKSPSALALARGQLRRGSLSSTKSVRGINVAPSSGEATQSDAMASLTVLAAMAEKQLAFPKTAFATVMAFFKSTTVQHNERAPLDTLMILVYLAGNDEDRLVELYTLGAFPSLLLPTNEKACRLLARLVAGDGFASRVGEMDFKALINAVLGLLSRPAPGLLWLLHATLHLLFHGNNLGVLSLLDSRSQFEQGLARMAAQGAEEEGPNYEMARACQAIDLALKVVTKPGSRPLSTSVSTPQATPKSPASPASPALAPKTPPGATKAAPSALPTAPGSKSPPASKIAAKPVIVVKSVVIIPSHLDPDAPAQASKLLASLTNSAEVHVAVEDGAGMPKAKRKTAVETAAQAVEAADWVVLVGGKEPMWDPVLRLFVYVSTLKGKDNRVLVSADGAGWWNDAQAKKRTDKVDDLGAVASW